MVFVDPKNLRYSPHWQRWVIQRSVRVWKTHNTIGSEFNLSNGDNYELNTSFLSNYQEQEVLNKLFEKYVHSCVDMILEGIVDGKQGQKLKTVVPQTDLNMVGSSCPL